MTKKAMSLVRMRLKEGQQAPIRVKNMAMGKGAFASGGAVPAFDPNKPFEAADTAPAFDPTKPFEPAAVVTATPVPTVSDRVLSGASKAIEPITSYPETYSQMNRESREQMSQGLGQITSPESSWWDTAKGAGNVALGAANFVGSPINAALRTVVGKPLEENTGIPKEYSEFAAGLALPGVGMTRLGKTAEAVKDAVPTAEAIKDAAKAAYKAPEVAALKIRPEALKFFGEEAAVALAKDGFDPILADKTFKLLEKATSVPDGTPFVTSNNVMTLRRQLGKAAESTDKTERAAAQMAMRKLDNFMASLPESAVLEGDAKAASNLLKEARDNYAAASRSERFTGAIDQAEQQAARAGMGGNLENATRQKISSILNSPSKTRGFSTEEKEALEAYVKGDFTRNGLRAATKMLGGDNPLMAAIHAGLAFPTHGLSLAAPLTGFALKKINNSVSSRDLAKIDELLRSRSPLAKQTEKAVSDWAGAGAALEKSPTTQNATRFFTATHFLTGKLGESGIHADLNQLLGPMQGPAPTRADEDQKPVGIGHQ